MLLERRPKSVPAIPGVSGLTSEAPVYIEVDAVEASVSCANLILRAHRLSNHFLLYLQGIGGERMLWAHLVFQRIESEQEALP